VPAIAACARAKLRIAFSYAAVVAPEESRAGVPCVAIEPALAAMHALNSVASSPSLCSCPPAAGAPHAHSMADACSIELRGLAWSRGTRRWRDGWRGCDLCRPLARSWPTKEETKDD